jgi:hypothetical protein
MPALYKLNFPHRLIVFKYEASVIFPLEIAYALPALRPAANK